MEGFIIFNFVIHLFLTGYRAQSTSHIDSTDTTNCNIAELKGMDRLHCICRTVFRMKIQTPIMI